jgi:hypothetical protein
MRTLKKPNKTQHDEKREPLVISRNVRKPRGLAFHQLVFVGICVVGTPGFEPGVRPHSAVEVVQNSTFSLGVLNNDLAAYGSSNEADRAQFKQDGSLAARLPLQDLREDRDFLSVGRLLSSQPAFKVLVTLPRPGSRKGRDESRSSGPSESIKVYASRNP